MYVASSVDRLEATALSLTITRLPTSSMDLVLEVDHHALSLVHAAHKKRQIQPGSSITKLLLQFQQLFRAFSQNSRTLWTGNVSHLGGKCPFSLKLVSGRLECIISRTHPFDLFHRECHNSAVQVISLFQIKRTQVLTNLLAVTRALGHLPGNPHPTSASTVAAEKKEKL